MMPGMIMLWYGSIESIPSGWALCDGANNTPDLRLKFVVGAGGAKSPDDSGGAIQHKHSFTGNGHTHNLDTGNDVIDSSPVGQLSSHSVSANASGDTDNSVGTAEWPPWYCLCYIMKLPIP